MIEDALVNYGVLGLWTLSLIVEKLNFQGQIKKIIQGNTDILKELKNKLC